MFPSFHVSMPLGMGTICVQFSFSPITVPPGMGTAIVCNTLKDETCLWHQGANALFYKWQEFYQTKETIVVITTQ